MASQAPSSLVVLVVDPRADEREMYCQYLCLSGFTAAEAIDGRSALEQVERMSPAVVTTELRLPALDGFTLCQRLKAQRPAIHVIAVTADGSPRGVAAAREAGFDAFLLKPCLPDLVLQEIRRLVDAGRTGPMAVLRGFSVAEQTEHRCANPPRRPLRFRADRPYAAATPRRRRAG